MSKLYINFFTYAITNLTKTGKMLILCRFKAQICVFGHSCLTYPDNCLIMSFYKDKGGVTVAEEIPKYKNLLDMGVITQDEFKQKKKQIMGL